MILNLRDIHILQGKCFETDSTVIQLLLIRNKKLDIYEAVKLNRGEIQESVSGFSHDNCEKTYDDWDKFYKTH